MSFMTGFVKRGLIHVHTFEFAGISPFFMMIEVTLVEVSEL